MSLDSPSDLTAYALVQFDDEDSTAVVPISRITCTGLSESPSMKKGDCVMVTWHNKKQYKATFVLSGEFALHYHVYFSVILLPALFARIKILL